MEPETFLCPCWASGWTATASLPPGDEPGAAAVLTSQELTLPEGGAWLRCDPGREDTKKGAAEDRILSAGRLTLPLVGVTGSVGKTTNQGDDRRRPVGQILCL